MIACIPNGAPSSIHWYIMISKWVSPFPGIMIQQYIDTFSHPWSITCTYVCICVCLYHIIYFCICIYPSILYVLSEISLLFMYMYQYVHLDYVLSRAQTNSDFCIWIHVLNDNWPNELSSFYFIDNTYVTPSASTHINLKVLIWDQTTCYAIYVVGLKWSYLNIPYVCWIVKYLFEPFAISSAYVQQH